MEIVVISSYGPMGSSCVAAILEKFGYLNLPIRKIGLSEYAMGERNLDDPYMKNRISKIIENHDRMCIGGGVSVIDRAENLLRRVDGNLIDGEISALQSKKFKTLAEMYSASKNLYGKASIYKKIPYNDCTMHIEMLTLVDFTYKPKELYQSFKRTFDAVHMIHIHRPFVSWCNSMISQSMISPLMRRYLRGLRIRPLYRKYMQYENFVNQLPGLHLDFDNIFLPQTKETLNQIADYLDIDVPKIKWENESYDLYGALKNYKQTFTKFDDNVEYLSKHTKSVIEKSFVKGYRINALDDLYTTLLYFRDLLNFKLNFRNIQRRFS